MTPETPRACRVTTPEQLREALRLRCEVYCRLPDPRTGRPLMQHPHGVEPWEPHDAADLHPGTQHYLLERFTGTGWQTAGSMRLLDDFAQARTFWSGFPSWLPANTREASRVSLHPDHRGDPLALYALLGAAAEQSLADGVVLWVATLRRVMLLALLQRGIPVRLLNGGEPVGYHLQEGSHRPLSGERLHVCVIDLTEARAALWAGRDVPVGETGVSGFTATFGGSGAPWRPEPHELTRGVALRDGIAATLAALHSQRG